MKHIILGKFTRLGDRVVMQMDKEARACGRPGPQDGTLGTVVGITRYKISHGHNALYPDTNPVTGIYEGNGAIYVKWDNGEAETVSCHDICFVDEKLNELRQQDTAYNEAFDTEVKVSDLPKLPYIEGATVILHTGETVSIKKIDYPIDTSYDPTKKIYYVNILSGQYVAASAYVSDEDIKKVLSHGNYFEWYYGDKANLKFKDISEEVHFYQTIGKLVQVRNSKTGYYTFTVKEFLEAIKKGEGHAVRMSGGLFGATPEPTLWKFVGEGFEDLIQRCKEEILKGFNQ